MTRVEYAGARYETENASDGRGRVVIIGVMAEWTGLEPATPGVTGRYSNQLNYHSDGKSRFPTMPWWVLRGSNPRPSPCKGDALPAELSTRKEPKVYGNLRKPAKQQANPRTLASRRPGVGYIASA